DLDKVPEYVPSPVGGHWYLRADIGMAWPSHGSHKPVFGAGIGYQFNDWLRADATLALSKGNVRFAHVAESACGGGPGTACGIEDRTSMRNISAFANIYADLGTVAGFTPYVGVGAGVAHIQWQEGSRAYSCMGESGMCPANGMTGQALAGH